MSLLKERCIKHFADAGSSRLTLFIVSTRLVFFFQLFGKKKRREKVNSCNVSAFTHECFHDSHDNVVTKPLGGWT